MQNKCNTTPIQDKKTFLNYCSKTLKFLSFSDTQRRTLYKKTFDESKQKTDYLKKTPYFKTTFQTSKYTPEQQKHLTKFNFQCSQINQDELEQLAPLFLKIQNVYATSKFDVGKNHSPLHHLLKPDAVFRKQRAI